jgi:1-acyl-sn-glycerol-3-phosphate acyltransferase
MTYSQISTASGFMKEKSLVGFPLGTLKRIEIPRFMKGFVKSITASRAKLIAIAPTATSAVPSISSEKNTMCLNSVKR